MPHIFIFDAAHFYFNKINDMTFENAKFQIYDCGIILIYLFRIYA